MTRRRQPPDPVPTPAIIAQAERDSRAEIDATLPRMSTGSLIHEYVHACEPALEMRDLVDVIVRHPLPIDLFGDIAAAGVDPTTGLPRIGIAQADWPGVHVQLRPDGGATFASAANGTNDSGIEIPAGSFPTFPAGSPAQGDGRRTHGAAAVPIVPAKYRPRPEMLPGYAVVWRPKWIDGDARIPTVKARAVPLLLVRAFRSVLGEPMVVVLLDQLSTGSGRPQHLAGSST